MNVLDFLKDIKNDTPCEWNELDEAINELEELQDRNCHTCKWITQIDHYCKHPETMSKHVAEYILFSGCGLHDKYKKKENK